MPKTKGFEGDVFEKEIGDLYWYKEYWRRHAKLPGIWQEIICVRQDLEWYGSNLEEDRLMAFKKYREGRDKFMLPEQSPRHNSQTRLSNTIPS
jgi:hypothetical protein